MRFVSSGIAGGGEDWEMAGELTAVFKALGFHYVTLDLEGYRQGAMNEDLMGSDEEDSGTTDIETERSQGRENDIEGSSL